MTNTFNRLPSHDAETEAAIQRWESEGNVVKFYKPYERTMQETTIEDKVRGNGNPDVIRNVA